MATTMYKLKYETDPMMAECGYEPKTSFWNDFCIADRFGVSAVKDTFRRAFREWRGNCEYLTELVLVLNHKIWQHYEQGHQEAARLYDAMWREADAWAVENLKGEELTYFYNTTD